MALFTIIWIRLVGAVWTVGTVMAAVALLELAFGVVRRQPRPWLRAATFWALTTPAVALSMTAVALLLQGTHPLLAAVRWVPAALVGAVVGDFFFYWAHRAYHRFGWLWRFHGLHHSIRALDALNSYHHVVEEFFRALLVLVPTALLLPSGPAPILAALIGLQGVFIHSNSRLGIGPLGWLIVDNRFHRLHHSIEPAHRDKNFGAFTTIWDILFGTAVFLAPGEWPETGVEGVEEPETVVAFLARPFLPGV